MGDGGVGGEWGLGEGRGGGGWERGEGKIGVVCRYGPDGFCPAVAIAVGKGRSGNVMRWAPERRGSFRVDG